MADHDDERSSSKASTEDAQTVEKTKKIGPRMFMAGITCDQLRESPRAERPQGITGSDEKLDQIFQCEEHELDEEVVFTKTLEQVCREWNTTDVTVRRLVLKYKIPVEGHDLGFGHVLVNPLDEWPDPDYCRVVSRVNVLEDFMRTHPEVMKKLGVRVPKSLPSGIEAHPTSAYVVRCRA